MSRGKPVGERGDDAGLSTRALAAQAAAIVRKFGLRLERLEQYLLQVRSQELTELDRLKIRLQVLERVVVDGLDRQRRHSVQVGMPDRWPPGGECAARAREHLVGPATAPLHCSEKALDIREEMAEDLARAVGPDRERMARGCGVEGVLREGLGDDWRARVEADPGLWQRFWLQAAGPGVGGDALAGREGPGAEPVERCPAGEGAAPPGGAGAGGAASGGAGGAGDALLDE